MILFQRSLIGSLCLSLAIPQGLFAQSTQTKNQAPVVNLEQEYTQLEDAVEKEKVAKPVSIDLFSLFPQKTFQERRLVAGFDWEVGVPKDWEDIQAFYNWNKLALRFTDDDGKTAQEIPLSTFTSQSVGYGNWKTCDATACRFELVKKDHRESFNDRIVHQFFMNAKNVAVLGPYIVFTTEDSAKNLKFIDLHTYENLIGNAAIPVFDIPMPVEGGIQSLESTGTHLKINNEFYLGANHLEQLAPLFSAAFNLTANMVDPEALSAAAPLYENLSAYMDRQFKTIDVNTKDVTGVARAVVDQEAFFESIKKSLEDAKAVGDASKTLKALDDANKKEKKKKTGNIGEALEAAGEVQTEYYKWLKDSDTLKQSVLESQKQIRQSRKVFARAQQILGFISKPLPEGSGAIKRAMKLIIGDSIRQSQSLGSKAWGFLKGETSLKELFTKNEMILGAKALGLVAINEFAPGALTALAGDGLLIGKEIYSYLQHVLYGAWDAYGTSFRDVYSIYTDYVVTPLYNQYYDPSQDRWYKTLVGGGVFLGTLAVVLGGYHVSRRLYDLSKDMRRYDYKGLIDRQNRIEHRFADAIAKAEAKQHELLLEGDERSEQDVLETRERLEKLKIERRHGFKWVQNIRTKIFGVKKSDTEIKTWLGALLHLLMSTASYRVTVGEYTPAFNWYASMRYSSFGWAYSKTMERNFRSKVPMMVKMRPLGIATRFLYPEFFATAVSSRDGRITFPTALNGGTTTLASKLGTWASNKVQRFLYPSRPEELELFQNLENVTADEITLQTKRIEEFEDQVINIEEQVIEKSLSKAMAELLQFSKTDSDLQRLFTDSDGIQGITSREIALLSLRNKVFVRSYMDILYEEVMREILALTLTPNTLQGQEEKAVGQLDLFLQAEKLDGSKPVTKKDLLNLKQEILAAAKQQDSSVRDLFNVSPELVGQIIDKHAARVDLVEKARQKASWAAMGLVDFKVIRNHIKTEVTAAFDGNQNPPMKNYEIIRKMSKDEVAMARATRNEISTLFRTLPIDILSKFVATAGIITGIMAPIQKEFWGENSIAYLSQYSFYGQLLAGIAFASVSSAWGKLRQDYYDANDGLFGEIPEGKDAESYVKWFIQKWNERDNSLFKYWRHNIEIMFWNIPAVIPQAILLDMAFLGRFDLDVFITGYVAAFFLPFHAFFYKLDQAFEQSSYYAARGLKNEDLSDPEVQKWLQKEMQKLRNRFTVVRDITLNPALEALANAEVTPTDAMGPRAFARYMFGGYTPTELIVLKMRDVAEGSTSEVVKKIMAGCETFLTNGNPDLIKLKK